VITYNRKPFLTGELECNILRFAWRDVQKRFPFETIAVCLLPNHLHCIRQLPEDDLNFSVRWKEKNFYLQKDILNKLVRVIVEMNPA